MDLQFSTLPPFEPMQVGNDLFEKVASLLDDNKVVGLLGPRMGGKAIVLEQVRSSAQARPAGEKPTISYLAFRKSTPISRGDFLAQIRTSMQLDIPKDIVTDTEGGLDLKIREIIEEAADRFSLPIWFLVEDILGLPARFARDLVSAIVWANQGPDRVSVKVSAAISGSTDFVSFCYGPNSPLRNYSHLLILGMTKDSASRYLSDSGIVIDDDALEHLYRETSGQPLLIQEFFAHVSRLQYNGNSRDIRNWTKDFICREMQDFVGIHLRFCFTLRSLLREVEGIPSVYDHVLRLLGSEYAEGIELPCRKCERRNKREECKECIQRILVSGIAVPSRDKQRIHFSSPLILRWFKEMMTSRSKSDALAAQGRWREAWEAYDSLSDEILERPLSGPPRFRLRERIRDWCDHVHSISYESPKIVLADFLCAARYFLEFRIGGLVVEKSGELEWVDEKCISGIDEPFPPEPHLGQAESFMDEKGREYHVLYDYGKRFRIICSDLKLTPLDPSESIPFLELARSHDSPVSHAEHATLASIFCAFLDAYDVARRIEYDKTSGSLQEKHLAAIKEINSCLFRDELDLKRIATDAARALCEKAGYLRVQICFRSESGRRIQRAAEFPSLFPNPTDYLLERPGIDIQPWVVENRRAAFVADATIDPSEDEHKIAEDLVWNTKQARECDPPMKAISVIPMVLGSLDNPFDRIIGTIHFERKEQDLPPEYERRLMQNLAQQIAAIFCLTERLVPREREKAAERAAREIGHSLAGQRRLPLALALIDSARNKINTNVNEARNMLQEAHAIVREGLNFASELQNSDYTIPVETREVSIGDLITAMAMRAKQDAPSLNVHNKYPVEMANHKVVVDSEMLREAASLLATNAEIHNIAAAKDGRIDLWIEVTALSNSPKDVHISFTNNGCCIPANVQQRMFDCGFSTRIGGTGIGLYTARRIMRSHNGNLIYEETTPENYPSFVLVIPWKRRSIYE